MDFYFFAYIGFCIILGLTAFTQLNGSGRLFAAIISLILLILIFVFYGQRWFTGTTSRFTYQGAWPPMINTCPDYLVYYKKGTGASAKDTCVDLIGVARSGTLQPWQQGETPTNAPEADNKYFKYVYAPGMTANQIKVLCQKAMEAGLTWEGITNGESCTYSG